MEIQFTCGGRKCRYLHADRGRHWPPYRTVPETARPGDRSHMGRVSEERLDQHPTVRLANTLDTGFTHLLLAPIVACIFGSVGLLLTQVVLKTA